MHLALVLSTPWFNGFLGGYATVELPEIKNLNALVRTRSSIKNYHSNADDNKYESIIDTGANIADIQNKYTIQQHFPVYKLQQSVLI